MKVIYKQQSDSAVYPLGIKDCYFKILSTNTDRRAVTRKLHHHNSFELHMVLEGNECYEVDGEQVDLRQGELLLLCPGTPHRVLFSHEKTEKYAVCFQADVTLSGSWYKCSTPQRIWERCTLICEEAVNRKQSSQYLIKNAVMEIVVTILRLVGWQEKRQISHSGEHIVLSMAKQYIADNIDFAPGIPEVAAYCALSTKQLVRIFSAGMDMSPGEYIKRQRIERVVHLICTTNLSLNEISAQMHFSSVYYLNTFFKKYVGMPPGEYRKMCCPQ